jgi:CRP-like cAMP-binding protein/polyferredoxin
VNDSDSQIRLDDVAIAYLRGGGSEVSFQDGEFIVHRGEPGRAFYVVLSGEVEVRLVGRDGRALPLSRFGPGASFGEMALLRDRPVSADVVALGPVTLLSYPAEDFPAALAECEPLRSRLLTRLASNLHRTSTEAWSFFQRAEALRMLIRDHEPPHEMVASSARMRAVRQEIDRLAQVEEPVLVSGGPGTGKLLAARLIHNSGHRPAAPLIIVDCLKVSGEEARKLILGTGDGPHAGEELTGFGAVHLAHGGTLVLHHADVLDAELQGALVSVAVPGESRPPFPRLRLIATRREEGDGTAPGGPLMEAIHTGGALLRMPRLSECRRDILPLARHFLHERAGEGAPDLSLSARHAVVSLPYRHRNVAQLREIMELAVVCADGGEIRAEHVFSGFREAATPIGFNLGEVGFFRRLVGGTSIPVVRAGVLAGFLGVTTLCIAAPFTAAGSVANALVWSVWEPLTFGLFLFVGRIWCTICPLSTGARLAQRFGSLERPPPEWLGRWGLWLAILGFFAIVWVERVFHTIAFPPATGLLLLTLLVLPIMFSLVYQREVWCRSPCPLGSLGAALAPAAPLNVVANSSVCASSCTTHECYKGSTTVPGCTVFHHPLDGSQSNQCKLCLDCLKSCPYDSARLYVRPPLVGVWQRGGPGQTFVPFALMVFLLAPVLLASQTSGWITSPLGFTLAGLVAIAGAVVLGRALPSLLGRSADTESPVPTQIPFALLVLGWGPLMAYQLANIPVLNSLHIGFASETSWTGTVAQSEFTLLTVSQAAVLLLAAAFSGFTLWRIHARAERKGDTISHLGWWVIVACCAAYLSASFLMLT